MLYQLYEAQRALLSPFSEFASASSKLYNHPLSPFAHTPLAHRVSASFELVHRLAKDYEKPEFGIRTIRRGDADIAVHEQVALEKPFCRLLRFKRFSDDPETLTILKNQPTVLVVAPLSGHHATLLRETVRELLKDHKVFVTDWTDARMVPVEAGPFHLDDYVEYVQEFIRFIGPDVNVISVCQPTVPVLAAISLMATAGEPTPPTMTMMGGPIDARKSPTAVNNLATNKSLAWFENNVIHRVPVNYPGDGRRVYPGFLQHAGFIAMNPDRHLKSHYDYFLDLVRGDDDSADFHRGFYDEYNAVLDMPAEYYLDTIKTVFQDFALVNGTWDVRGQRVRPQDITTSALLTIEGELDDISGAGQTHSAHSLCTSIPESRRFSYDAAGAGHYGIFSGRRWREKVYPQIRDFIANHHPSAAAETATLVPGGGTAGVPGRARKVRSSADGYTPPPQVPDGLREAGPATAPDGLLPTSAAAVDASPNPGLAAVESTPSVDSSSSAKPAKAGDQPAAAAPAKRVRGTRRGAA
ncbi:polyhydroxyalkanoate depolymerase [Piscinibacter koreensis]|uniref:Polyhydroxyalkanoate depolymerase n=1 Tax=Piscinibacter koreensis TaxID=2742824 RepID=A0A7Y6NRS3_9BURK|nr:polyhydroxyalkanoate depolymerase [Schlegelella koreensis]NUZ08113.1 polyhydroxyalkanoate depolymerase [Schlegelella koreensis]